MSCIYDELLEPYYCESDWNCKDCPNWIDEKLKPCPFCGQEVTMRSTSKAKSFVISHKRLRNCAFYKFEIPWEVGESLINATTLWNRRAEQ